MTEAPPCDDCPEAVPESVKAYIDRLLMDLAMLCNAADEFVMDPRAFKRDHLRSLVVEARRRHIR